MPPPDDSRRLRVRFLDVGQGDAIIVFLPGQRRALVVDVFDWEKVLTALEEEATEELVLFASHSDRDHVLGVENLLHNFQGALLACFYNMDRLSASLGSLYVNTLRSTARAMRGAEGAWGAPFGTGLNHDDRFSQIAAPPASLQVLYPSYAELTSLLGVSTNEAAGVLRIVWRLDDGSERSVLLTGDVELTGISCMLNRLPDGSALRADVLKFPHHGAWPNRYRGIAEFPGLPKRSIVDFLRAVDPQVVVLSVGLDNADRHVRSEVFESLVALAAEGSRLSRILCTQFTATCLLDDVPCDAPRCAGDIEVRIGEGIPGGMQVLPAGPCHARRILSITDVAHAGCGPLLHG